MLVFLRLIGDVQGCFWDARLWLCTDSAVLTVDSMPSQR
jgi:hypothetical protein